MEPILVPGAPLPVQPVPAKVTTVEKTPGAGKTAVPAELHGNSEGRHAIPLLDSTKSPVQITPAKVTTVEKSPAAGTTALPTRLRDRSQPRPGIPAPRVPGTPAFPVPLLVLSAPSVNVPARTFFVTVTVGAHPESAIGAVTLKSNGSLAGTIASIIPGVPTSVQVLTGAAAGTYNITATIVYNGATITSNVLAVTHA